MAEITGNTDIREYAEEMPVSIITLTDEQADKGVGRIVIIAYNEGGYNCTHVDLLDVIDWVKKNKPELLKS